MVPLFEHSSSPGAAGPAFVAGATGFTGREVVRLLAARGILTYAHVRPDSPRREEWQQRLQRLGAQVDCTPWEEGAMAATLARLRPAYVFALLGTTRRLMKQVARTGQDPQSQSYQNVDYGLTALLLRAAMAAGSRPRFIYLSAAGVNERARSPYYQARARAEAELKASALPFLIARPSLISGPGRDEPRPGERIGAAVVDGLLRVAGLFGGWRLQARYASTTNTALAEALVRLALDPAAANRTFESESLRPVEE
ncbi:MAG: epimerase [Deltaproteobacteria bacterium RBG_13_61_14]|nr:MAG: epimerase [Deltaproteobacteria bacterium RBG_13_61_14]